MSKEIQRALAVLFPGTGVVELRALADYNTHSGYFDDLAELAEKAGQISRLSDVHGVYVTLNEVNPALLSRRANRVKMKLGRKDATTADADIIRRRWLPIDLDPVRPSGVSSTDEEHDAAIAKAKQIAGFLLTIGFPRPLLADSGNGAHLLYPIDLPNEDEATALIKDCLATLDALFSDDTVTVDTANYNAARIWKLYGTMSRKGDNTKERPHRMAAIIEAPGTEETVEAEILPRLANLLPKEETKPAPKKGEKKTDLSRWLSEHGITVRSERPWQGGTLYVLDECPFSSAHSDGAFAIQFDNGAIYAGCHHNSCGSGKQRWAELRGMFEIKKTRRERRTAKENPEKVAPAPASPPVVEDSPVTKKALDILRNGNPLEFILDAFVRDHVGDKIVAECLIMSVASQSVANTKGLHVSISGNSGKGKTHACNAMLRLLPEEYRIKGTVSNKALFYYDELRAGTVLLFDDVTMSDDLQELMKSATANFQEPIEHRTLTRDRQLKVCTIPERCVWWLAKVEAVGDDQVMNRMLTVWIDDSADQDRAVLEHLKKIESGRLPPAGEDENVMICQLMIGKLKEKVHRVRIPYAGRINFSAAHNRRNPAMLLDLIKCHAVLHFLQRETDEDGSLIADLEDFTYARKLFISINNDVGGQETKLTRNESAALATIRKMGLSIFTVRQLQDALGLSYHQTYRILHGYSNSRASYLGILDKCPAISLIDATVVEELCGVEARRREHYFSFDHIHYKSWSAQADVWLEEEPEDDGREDDDNDDGEDAGSSRTLSPSLHQKIGNCANETDSQNDRSFYKGIDREERRTESIGILHELPGTQSGPSPTYHDDGSVCMYVCDPEDGAKQWPQTKVSSPILNSAGKSRKSWCKSGCKGVEGVINVKTKAVTGAVLPLPGLLDHRDFERVSVELGKCSLCENGRAVFSSKDLKMNICEGCYGRLLREENEKNGIK